MVGPELRGRVTQVLPGLIDKHGSEIIYSCGPMGMLAAINEISSSLGLLHQCAVEEAMACGIGICMTCVIPVKDSSGVIKMTRSCIDGPVMDGAKVIWDSSRKVPQGTWGFNG